MMRQRSQLTLIEEVRRQEIASFWKHVSGRLSSWPCQCSRAFRRVESAVLCGAHVRQDRAVLFCAFHCFWWCCSCAGCCNIFF